MGNFSRNTFDPNKRYTGVRLQQGVPLVDADINELQDVLRHAFEQVLQQFLGNGVPFGDNGFAIGSVPAPDDFSIGAGRCLVRGREVINAATINYAGQRLFGDATLATDWGVDPLPALTRPAAAQTDIAYLDVWEREVDSSEDTDIVNPLIGIETSVRNRREWVVRVAEGAAVPAPPAGHAFYPLASFEHRPDGSLANITDGRRTGLKMPSYHDLQQIMADAFGSGYPIAMNAGPNTGQPQLKVSLRDTINALLKGGLPATPEIDIETAGNYIIPEEMLRLASGEIWLTYSMADPGGSGQILLRYDRYDPGTDTWISGGQITDQLSTLGEYSGMTEDAAGRIWVAWVQTNGSDREIHYWRYDPSTDTSVGPLPLTSGNTDRRPRLVTDASGRVWLFFERRVSGNTQVFHSRYDAATDSWGTPEQRTPGGNREDEVSPLAHSNGEVWVFWTSNRDGNDNIYFARYDPTTDAWAANASVTTDAGDDEDVVAVEDANGDIWAFWLSDRAGDDQVFARRFNMALNAWDSEFQITTRPRDVDSVQPLATSNGDLWIFWYESGSGSLIAYYKRKAVDGSWGDAVRLASGNAAVPHAAEGADGNVMTAYARVVSFTPTFDIDLVARQLIPEI